MLFADRSDAGRRLAEALAGDARLVAERPVVLGLPRGGVPVAAEVARALGAPLDVILVRKLGVPHQPELAMGAIGEGGVKVLDPRILAAAGVTDRELAAVERAEGAELARRGEAFRAGGRAVPLAGRTVVLVDDGIATGSTARAAVEVARAHGAARVVVATPVAPDQTLGALEAAADAVVCLATPEPFLAIGAFYRDFAQTSDDEVVELLAKGRSPGSPEDDRRAAEDHAARNDEPDVLDVAVEVTDGARLPGRLALPHRPFGVVAFAHGSGSSHTSSRNRAVARALNEAGMATLLFDLLTPAEAADRANVFDVGLLAHRLTMATQWLRRHPATSDLPLGYFGASTGAAAALVAAAEPYATVRAVVSRGGRPDLAGTRLGAVRAPTLLVVGGNDHEVLALNEAAARSLRCDHRLEVVPGATHLFEEPGALEAVASLAGEWFAARLRARSSALTQAGGAAGREERAAARALRRRARLSRHRPPTSR